MSFITKSLLKKRIQQIYEKAVQKGVAFKNAQQTVTYCTLNLNANYLARIIAKTVEQRKFRPSYLHPKKIYRHAQERIVFPLTPIDNIVQGVLFEVLLKNALPKISKHVHSYIPGRSTITAIQEFTRYLKQFNQQFPTNDLFILRSDITKFTDSIPLNPDSHVWGKINALIDSIDFDKDEHDYIKDLTRAFIQPYIETRPKNPYQSFMGLPMGTPLSSIVANLYLADLDFALEALPDIFYLRYGDDLLIAHPNSDMIKQAEKIYDSHLEKLQLTRNPSKDLRLYFTLSARPYIDNHWHGTQAIDYIGFSVNRAGNKTISLRRRHRLCLTLKERIRRTTILCQNFPLNKQVEILSIAIANALDANNPQAIPEAVTFLKLTNDRSILQHFDYWLAFMISKSITGIKSPRTFRTVSIKQIRNYLPALAYIKNKI